MCSGVVCVVGSHSEVIPVIQKQLRGILPTWKNYYFSLWQLLRGQQDPVDDTIGLILLLPSCMSVSRLHLLP